MYDVLGIESSATARDVTVAYRDIAALIHPDKCAEANASEPELPTPQEENEDELSAELAEPPFTLPASRGAEARQLPSYSQSTFAAACSSIAYDIDGSGVVDQDDIGMFTYFLLNKQALNYAAFCPYLQQ